MATLVRAQALDDEMIAEYRDERRAVEDGEWCGPELGGEGG